MASNEVTEFAVAGDTHPRAPNTFNLSISAKQEEAALATCWLQTEIFIFRFYCFKLGGLFQTQWQLINVDEKKKRKKMNSVALLRKTSGPDPFAEAGKKKSKNALLVLKDTRFS